MKTKTPISLTVLLLGLLSGIVTAAPLGTAFTYQGKLTDGANPANGTYDLKFSLHDALSSGSQVGSSKTNAATVVTNGYFTATLDFGGVFDGNARWLELGVRTNGGSGFNVLNPRQRLTPTPSSLFAATVNDGAITTSKLASGSVGPLQLAANAVSASHIADNTIVDADILSIGAGKVIGGDLRAQRLKVGSLHNLTGVNATIAGGASSTAAGDYSSIGGGQSHTASGTYATVSGGFGNTAFGQYSSVAGGMGNWAIGDFSSAAGLQNWAAGLYAHIGGGVDNKMDFGFASAIAGGWGNTNHGDRATIGGGEFNRIAQGAFASVIPGGSYNSVASSYSLAAGRRAQANHSGSFVWADGTDTDFASTSNHQFLIRASGGVGIGTRNPAQALHVNGSVQLDKTGSALGRLILNTVSRNDPGRYGIQFLNNLSAPFLGDDTQPIAFNFMSSWSNQRANDATLKVLGKATNSWGTFLALTHDGTNGVLSTDTGHLLLTPAQNVGLGRVPVGNKLEVEGNASKTAAGSWLANSDARIKQDIQPVTGALDKLLQVRLVSFHYTDDYRQRHPSIEDRAYVNVVAQEFQRIFPEAVKPSGEKLATGGSILQVDTYPLTIYSAAAVQELNQKLEQKESEITELKVRLERLEQLFNAENGGSK
jgi:hypothetical protein